MVPSSMRRPAVTQPDSAGPLSSVELEVVSLTNKMITTLGATTAFRPLQCLLN
jgi:hypothetical protein